MGNVVKDGTSFDYNVPGKVERLIEQGFTSIVIMKDYNGWDIMARKETEEDE